MKLASVSRSLNIIRNELSDILDKTTAVHVLAAAQKMAEQSYNLYRSEARKSHYKPGIVEHGWGFSIRDAPLEFARTDISGYPFRIDLTCEFRWKGEADKEPAKGNITVRMWALSDKMLYRKDLDAEHLEALDQRVMMRFHFDLADPQQSAPKYHLQIGGVADANEYCWLHARIEKPRFAHVPMDLVLVCELIGATFYESDFKRICTSDGWKSIIRESQKTLLEDYLRGCLHALENDRSILIEHLWQNH